MIGHLFQQTGITGLVTNSCCGHLNRGNVNVSPLSHSFDVIQVRMPHTGQPGLIHTYSDVVLWQQLIVR